jgi:DNA-binding response OmpR family regulator
VTRHNSRTLLVDEDGPHGVQLVEQLNHAGFKTDFAMSWGGARASLATNEYLSCVVVAGLEQLTDLANLDGLRGAAANVWMIVLSDLPRARVQRYANFACLDAILPVSFSMHDLTSRLAAYSQRGRRAS